MGCWQFGSRDWGYGRGYADETAIELVHTALDLGVNLIDTAEVYARGVSETIVGRALAERRNEAFIATKVLPSGPRRIGWRSTAGCRRCGFESTLIDLYQVHWPNPVVPLKSTMEGMRRLQDTGSCATSV